MLKIKLAHDVTGTCIWNLKLKIKLFFKLLILKIKNHSNKNQ